MQFQFVQRYSTLRRLAAALCLTAGVLLLAGCGGGGGSSSATPAPVNPVNLVQQSVGPAGGSIVSSDGKLTLEIPPGALAAAVTIGIEAIPLSALSAASRALNPALAYRFTPDGLTFLVPAIVHIASDEVPLQVDGSISVNIEPASLESSSGVLESLPTGVRILAGNQLEKQATITHFSDFIFGQLSGPNLEAVRRLNVIVRYTQSLVVGQTAFFRITYGIQGTFPPLSNLRFPLFPGDDCGNSILYDILRFKTGDVTIDGRTADSDKILLGGINAVPPACGKTTRIATATLGESDGVIEIPYTCNKKSSGFINFNLRIARYDFFTAETTNPLGLFVECTDPNSTPTFRPVEAPLTTTDGLKFPVTFPAPGGSTTGVLVTGTRGAALVDPNTGSVLRSFDTTTAAGTTPFQNGTVLYPLSGIGNPALVLSASTTRGLLQSLDANTGVAVGLPVFTSGIDAGFGLVGLFTPTAQPTEVINRTSSSFTSPGKVQVIRLATPPATGLVVNREVTLPTVPGENLTSSTALPAFPLPDLSRVLYTTFFFNPLNSTTTYRLRLADYTGATPISTLIDPLGQNSQKVACDATTGLCAVSNCSFPSDFVSVYRWPGGPTVEIGPRVPSLSCAFAIDVFGNRIVVTGFNDNQYAVGTVDFNNSLNTVFAPARALPTGCTSPNTVTFKRDAQNTVVVSCGGSSPGVAVIPGAY